MEKSMQLQHTIEAYASDSQRVRIWHIIQPIWSEPKHSGDVICETCARIAAANAESPQHNPQVELRLRKLVSIIRSMQELGLIE